jgi:hypothetical protein
MPVICSCPPVRDLKQLVGTAGPPAAVDALRSHVLTHDQPPALKAFNPDVPDELVGLIARLHAKPPEGRPSSAAAVAEVLEAIEARVAARRTTGQPGLLTGEKPERSWWGTLLMLVLGGIGWGVYWYGDRVTALVRAWAQDVNRATERR